MSDNPNENPIAITILHLLRDKWSRAERHYLEKAMIKLTEQELSLIVDAAKEAAEELKVRGG